MIPSGQFVDPTLEPESLVEGEFRRPPKGLNVIQFKKVTADFNFKNSKGIIGVNWEIEFAFPVFDPSLEVTAKVWMNNTSEFGATMLHNMFLSSGIPYTIPDPTNVSLSTGMPRKSFAAAVLVRQLDGTYSVNESAFIGRKLMAPIRYSMRCPECKWLHIEGEKIAKNKCKNMKDASQGDPDVCYYGIGEKVESADGRGIYTDIDTTSMMPYTEMQTEQQNAVFVEPQVQQPQVHQPQPQPQAPIQMPAPVFTPAPAQVPVPALAPSQPPQSVIGCFTKEENTTIIAELRKTGHIPEIGQVIIDSNTYGGKFVIMNGVITNFSQAATAPAHAPVAAQAPSELEQYAAIFERPQAPPSIGQQPNELTTKDDLPF